MKALVTDAHLRSVLAGIRGLGRSGHPVLAVGPHRAAAGLWSRYTSGRAVTTADQREAVAGLVARHGPVVVYPGSERTLDALLAGPLPRQASLPYGEPGALAALRDKRSLGAVAAEVGLSSPGTLVEATAGELRRWSPPRPCVVKPARPNGALGSASVAASAQELHHLVGHLPVDEPLLVQERARGPLTALALVLDRSGVVVARFQQITSRTWPTDAGVSTVAQSVELEPRLADPASRMLASVGYSGLAQLQFVEGPDGPALIDVNPRFYGSLPLALACGVNLPGAWHASLTNGSAGAVGEYRLGVFYHWLEGELLAAREAPSGPSLRSRLHLPPRPRTGAVWASDDPVASAIFGLDLGARIAGRRLRRRR